MPSWSTSRSRTHRQGFTLVEILVVVPIVILVVAVLVGFLVTLTGDALVSRERAESAYTTQDALNQIEQDIRLAWDFRETMTPPSPQGINNATGSFNNTASQLLLVQHATSNRPTSSDRKLIYYANSPNTCSENYEFNDTLETWVIYFLDGSDLRRRTVVNPSGSLCLSGSETVWQKNSCKVSTYSYARCEASDQIVATDVSQFNIKYYTRAKDTSEASKPWYTPPTTATVELRVSKSVAGSLIAHEGTVRASRTSFNIGSGTPHF